MWGCSLRYFKGICGILNEKLSHEMRMGPTEVNAISIANAANKWLRSCLTPLRCPCCFQRGKRRLSLAHALISSMFQLLHKRDYITHAILVVVIIQPVLLNSNQHSVTIESPGGNGGRVVAVEWRNNRYVV